MSLMPTADQILNDIKSGVYGEEIRDTIIEGSLQRAIDADEIETQTRATPSVSEDLTFEQIITAVRTATYGRDVREALAQACLYAEEIYEDALKERDIASVPETKAFLGITH